MAAFEASRFALGRKMLMRFEINGSKGSLAFDFENMNVLEHYDGRVPATGAGFTRIQVTEQDHPYLSAWWPPGHGLGYEHGFTHQVIDLVHGDRQRRGCSPDLRRRPARAARARRCGGKFGGVQHMAIDPHRQLTGTRRRGREDLMKRPITLFTGQWADLPFEKVAGLAAGWGYDGLEIACWGDHLDVWRGAEDDGYLDPAGDPGPVRVVVYAISTISRVRRSATTRSMRAIARSCPTGSGVTEPPKESANGPPRR